MCCRPCPCCSGVECFVAAQSQEQTGVCRSYLADDDTVAMRDEQNLLIPHTAELSTGRMDPRVGSGHDFAGFWRVGSGRVSTSDF